MNRVGQISPATVTLPSEIQFQLETDLGVAARMIDPVKLSKQQRLQLVHNPVAKLEVKGTQLVPANIETAHVVEEATSPEAPFYVCLHEDFFLVGPGLK